MHGQCDARPTVTFPAAGHRHHVAGSTKLYYSVTDARVQRTRRRLLPKSKTAKSFTRDLLSRKSNALTRTNSLQSATYLYCLRMTV